MTEEQIRAWEHYKLCAYNIGSVTVKKEDIFAVDDLIKSMQSCIEQLEEDKETLINGQLALQKDVTFKQLQINNLEKIRCRKDEELSEQMSLIMVLDQKLDTAKVEAIKEFAKSLRQQAFDRLYVSIDEIDNLVKEMVGEQG